MTLNASLGKRLVIVKTAIAELQKHIPSDQKTNWLQSITGSFKDEPAFDEVLAYGKAIRQGDESLLEVPNEL